MERRELLLSEKGYRKLRKALWKQLKARIIDETTYFRRLNDLKRRYERDRKRKNCPHHYIVKRNVRGEKIVICSKCGDYFKSEE